MGTDFREKHSPDAVVEPDLEKALKKVVKDGTLACAVAFALAEESGYSPADIGKATDVLGFRLAKCQMGLFGYKPNKKIIKPASIVEPDLEAAIKEQTREGGIPCFACWDIAKRLHISKMSVSSACETLEIRIKPCQLGAF
ncbi:conserved hypothetical protein [Desulfatibacillum aliphaticivorans]|uniref:Uncharacterized protein n=1 Tax=Desulfatibacillum aliphaticivorans TaxID=218208 RepID=B8FDZ4_DESAL|nr:hypothetical protein [Desulfatibacillum aliphaticivorans]ACL06775.1 conserved hypothetical protein [Desulfatibacillum aliphaticivorans]